MLNVTEKEKKQVLYFVFALVVALNIWLAFWHVFFRDETQAWLIARDTSLRADSLFEVTSYEGHPFFWFVLLMPFAKAGFSSVTLKVMSWLFCTMALYVFMFKVETSFYIKIIAAISPMFVCFNVVPARSYSVAVFFVTILMALINNKKNRPILYGIILALLLQTLLIYGGFVFACCLVWLFEVLEDVKNKRIDLRSFLFNLFGLSIVFISALFLLWEFRFTSEIVGNENIQSMSFYLKNVVYQLVYGNKLLFGDYFILACCCIGVALFILRKNTAAVKAFVILICGIGFQVYIYAFVYYNDHHRVISWLFILLYVMNVLYLEYNDKNNMFCRIIIGLIVFLLALNTSYSCDVILNELNPNLVFSQSRQLAIAINNLPENAAVFISSTDADTSVVAQVDRKHSVYSPFTRNLASYRNRDPKYIEKMDYQTFIRTACEMFPDYDEIYVIVQPDDVTIYNLMDVIDQGYETIEVVYRPDIDSYAVENFYLVRIKL